MAYTETFEGNVRPCCTKLVLCLDRDGMFNNEWPWSKSRVCLLKLKGFSGSVLQLGLPHKQKYGLNWMDAHSTPIQMHNKRNVWHHVSGWVSSGTTVRGARGVAGRERLGHYKNVLPELITLRSNRCLTLLWITFCESYISQILHLGM